MTTIRKEIASLKALTKTIAASAGEPQILATQEVTHAFKAGTITKAQKDVLQRAISEGRNDVKSVQMRLDSFAEVFEKGDVNKNGRSEKSEQKQWNDAYTEWSWKAASPRRDPFEINALRAKTLTMSTVHSDGKVTSSPLWGVGTLLKKLDALVANKVTAGGE
jgi:hypothetical protein